MSNIKAGNTQHDEKKHRKFPKIESRSSQMVIEVMRSPAMTTEEILKRQMLYATSDDEDLGEIHLANFDDIQENFEQMNLLKIKD